MSDTRPMKHTDFNNHLVPTLQDKIEQLQREREADKAYHNEMMHEANGLAAKAERERDEAKAKLHAFRIHTQCQTVPDVRIKMQHHEKLQRQLDEARKVSVDLSIVATALDKDNDRLRKTIKDYLSGNHPDSFLSVVIKSEATNNE